MKYDVVYVCGHSGTITLFGNGKVRERKLQLFAESLCPECYKKQKQAEIEAKKAELGLPELKGSEKQVAWAETIRKEFIDVCESEIERLNEDITTSERHIKEYEEEKQNPRFEISRYDKRIENCQKNIADFKANIQKVKDAFDVILTEASAKFWIDNMQQRYFWLGLYEELHRASRIVYLNNHPEIMEEIRVPYALYKEEIGYCKTKKDSYDSETKTIIVLVPNDDANTHQRIDKYYEKKKADAEAKKAQAEADKRHTIAIRYADYKKDRFKDRIKKSITNSYNSDNRTIKVIVKTDEDVEFIQNHYNDKKVQKKNERSSKQYDLEQGRIEEYEIVPETIDAAKLNVEIPEELRNDDESRSA